MKDNRFLIFVILFSLIVPGLSIAWLTYQEEKEHRDHPVQKVATTPEGVHLYRVWSPSDRRWIFVSSRGDVKWQTTKRVGKRNTVVEHETIAEDE
jgi:crotonobetainyl-CoA:carnitine CoA-transferase CaiB-like acyl-CoA transferase